MNERQRRFAAEYLIDMNATRAAVRAGYSEKTARSQGQRLLTNVDIQKAIAAAQDRRAERPDVTRNDVVEGLYREATREGEGSTHTARVNAWGLLGRHVGMFTERFEHQVRFGDLSDDQIDARIAELSAEVGIGDAAGRKSPPAKPPQD